MLMTAKPALKRLAACAVLAGALLSPLPALADGTVQFLTEWLKLNREIARLQRSIAQLEKRLLFVNEKFPLPAPIPEDTENEEVTPETEPETGEIEPPVILTEDTPEVIAAYRRDFPNRPIVILPAETPDYNYDDLPVAPRKAA